MVCEINRQANSKTHFNYVKKYYKSNSTKNKEYTEILIVLMKNDTPATNIQKEWIKNIFRKLWWNWNLLGNGRDESGRRNRKKYFRKDYECKQCKGRRGIWQDTLKKKKTENGWLKETSSRRNILFLKKNMEDHLKNTQVVKFKAH